MKQIIVPSDYDYIGVYLTDKCPYDCSYCITRHHHAKFGRFKYKHLTADQWISALNRLELPKDVPITFQGGEPFIYQEIWKILEGIRHKVDIMTALPPFLTKEHFLKVKTLAWNKREAPYPTIRVSYHKGQNDYKVLIERIADLQDSLSIGLYYLDHPAVSEEEIRMIREYAQKYKVELRIKEFLGVYEGKQYGALLYPEAIAGERLGKKVFCRNTVVPVAPDGTIFLCHSDLYFNRKEAALGNILDDSFGFPKSHLPCDNYGLCNECDVKIKTNHYQQYGYTSVDIKVERENSVKRFMKKRAMSSLRK